MADLEGAGIDYDDVIEVLEREGVEKFEASWTRAARDRAGPAGPGPGWGSDATPPSTPRPPTAWARLTALADGFSPDLRGVVRRRPGPRRAAHASRPPTSTSTCPRTSSTTTCSPRCSRWRTRCGLTERRDAMFRGEHINVTEDRAVLHTALRLPGGRHARGRRPGRRRRRARGAARGSTTFAEQVRSGAWTGVTGRAHPHGRQHRHRRLRPRPGDGLRGAGALRPGRAWSAASSATSTRPTPPRRWPASTRRPRCSSCPARPSARWRRSPTPGCARRGCSTGCAPGATATDDARGRGEALRRGLDRARQGGRLRHRPRQRLRLLGLGRRPLLPGLRDRHLARGRDRPGAVRRAAGRHARDGRALPHHRPGAQRAGADGAAQRLVRQLPRRRDPRRAAVRPAAAPLPGVPPAADDGVQRQERPVGRHPGDHRRPARCSGASPAPTASTRSTS